MVETRQKIINSSITLFNNRGIVNVRLQEIADHVGISVGNLAYHFYSKKAIVIEIELQLESKLSPSLYKKKHFPYFIDFDNHLSNYFFLINTYSFYFLDILELKRAYPKIYSNRQKYILKTIKRNVKWMEKNNEIGKFKKEVFKSQYLNISKNIWLNITFWMTQKEIFNENINEYNFKKKLWSQLIPLFTSKGTMEFNAFILPNLTFNDDDKTNDEIFNKSLKLKHDVSSNTR